MRIFLVTGKPSVTACVLPHLLANHPGLTPDDLVVLHLASVVGFSVDARYPRELRWSDYPIVMEPAYAPIDLTHPKIGVRRAWRGWTDGESTSSRHGRVPVDTCEALRFCRDVDLVVGSIDDDPTSRLAFSRLLHDLRIDCGRTKVVDMAITTLDDRALADATRSALAGEPPWSEEDPRLGFARLKRRFDYNFTLNSRGVLGRTLRRAGVDPTVPAPSKFQVQALYALREHGPVSIRGLICLMKVWPGTGRYEAAVRSGRVRIGFGTETSRFDIVAYLRTSGLVEGHDAKLAVSSLGHAFLDALHPGCRDPDLPFRLGDWCGMPEAEGSARIDRYLKTWFGRQVRYLAKGGRRDGSEPTTGDG